ncbi:MAG: hypothetical protein HQ567_17930 [Candidatus Nealsonbacteria bacterium]|nr:hypothetical protein [Candidatus Nealsonbacteria bacterium]
MEEPHQESRRQESPRLDPFRDGPWARKPGESVWLPDADCPACGSDTTRPVGLVFSLHPLRGACHAWLLNLWKCDHCGKRFSVPGPRLLRFLAVSIPILLLLLVVLVFYLLS